MTTDLPAERVYRIAAESFKATGIDIYPRMCDEQVDLAFARAVIDEFCELNNLPKPVRLP